MSAPRNDATRKQRSGTAFANLTFVASFENVSRTLTDIEGPLRRELDSPDMADAVLTVLGEALNNVVEHAYRGKGDGTIDLKMDLGSTGMSVDILDRGYPISGQLPDGCAPLASDTAIEDLPEGGFGWSMIRALTSELHYERADGRNRLFCMIAHPEG